MNYLHRTSFLTLIFTIVLILSSDFVFAQSIMYEMGSAAEVEYECGDGCSFSRMTISWHAGGGAQKTPIRL